MQGHGSVYDVDGAKLSKSARPRLEPTELAEAHGADALRWWFARAVHPSVGSDFARTRLVERANEDLAGGLGHLAARITTLIHRDRGGTIPQPETVPPVEVEDACGRAQEAFGEFRPREGCQRVVEAVTAANREIERTRPWNHTFEPVDEPSREIVRLPDDAGEQDQINLVAGSRRLPRDPRQDLASLVVDAKEARSSRDALDVENA